MARRYTRGSDGTRIYAQARALTRLARRFVGWYGARRLTWFGRCFFRRSGTRMRTQTWRLTRFGRCFLRRSGTRLARRFLGRTGARRLTWFGRWFFRRKGTRIITQTRRLARFARCFFRRGGTRNLALAWILTRLARRYTRGSDGTRICAQARALTRLARRFVGWYGACLLYTSDAADE